MFDVQNRALQHLRKLAMQLDEIRSQCITQSLRLFNLDLHISVIEDLKTEFARQNANLISWSISNSNRITRKFFKIPDPVDFINNASWQNLNDDLIDQFISRYYKFLNSFDGFVVTHTPSFSQIFERLHKPILVVSSTRYEAPFSDKPNSWSNLNKFLINGHKSGQVLLTANNRGDQDYLNYHLGIKPAYIPSLCDYTAYTWKPNDGVRIIVSRSQELAEYLSQKLDGRYIPYRNIFNKTYSWKEFNKVQEVFYVPHNMSTMTLFEFASAGIPVTVPSRKLMKELRKKSDSVLSELSYFQIMKLDVSDLEFENPNNYRSPDFYDWWLDRADFYNSALMPNVRVINSLEELRASRQPLDLDTLEQRNRIIFSERRTLVSTFLTVVQNS